MGNEAKIIKYLYGKEVKPSIKGFKYLITAIDKCINNSNLIDEICNLYKDIAVVHNTTASKTERAIRHAISISNAQEKNGDFIARAFYELKIRGQADEH